MEPVLPGPKARAPPPLYDHLLEEILARIGAPADLARASAACQAFRRITTNPNFLRRYRSLHPPLLLGCIPARRFLPAARHFLPADAPHPAAHAFALAADFSCDDHLPPRPSSRRGWERYDVRDGRVLVMSYCFDGVLVSPKLALCEPLTRECTPLPPIPGDLLASVVVQMQDRYFNFPYAFFDPSVGNENAQFRVMCWIFCFSMVVVFVYSSGCGSWTHGTSVSWAALGFNQQLGHGPKMFRWIGYAYGCVYWDVGISNKLLKLDINSMEVTTPRLPSGHENRPTIVVEVGEGRIGIFSLNGFKNPLHCSIWQNESDNANEHLLDATIPLPRECECYRFHGEAHGYIFLIGRQHVVNTVKFKSAFLSLEIKTNKVERVCSPRLSGLAIAISRTLGFHHSYH